MARQFSNVTSKYGAPMGRGEYGNAPERRTVKLYRVRLDSGGYDDGGAYWGHGAPLWCAEAEDYRRFIRASDRTTAARELGITAVLRKGVTHGTRR